MKLKDQVCSLELAKRLKELGIKQESLWWWVKLIRFSNYELAIYHPEANLYKYQLADGSISFSLNQIEKEYSAFTVAELGEMLPEFLSSSELFCPMITKKMSTDKYPIRWGCNYYGGIEKTFLNEWIYADTEANARAKMLIYLKENKLI